LTEIVILCYGEKKYRSRCPVLLIKWDPVITEPHHIYFKEALTTVLLLSIYLPIGLPLTDPLSDREIQVTGLRNPIPQTARAPTPQALSTTTILSTNTTTKSCESPKTRSP